MSYLLVENRLQADCISSFGKQTLETVMNIIIKTW